MKGLLVWLIWVTDAFGWSNYCVLLFQFPYLFSGQFCGLRFWESHLFNRLWGFNFKNLHVSFAKYWLALYWSILIPVYFWLHLTDLHELLIENLHQFVLESIGRFFPSFLIFFFGFPSLVQKCIVNLLLRFISTYNISFDFFDDDRWTSLLVGNMCAYCCVSAKHHILHMQELKKKKHYFNWGLIT